MLNITGVTAGISFFLAGMAFPVLSGAKHIICKQTPRRGAKRGAQALAAIVVTAVGVTVVAATLSGCPSPTGGNETGTQQVDSDNTWHHNASGHWKDYDNGVKYDEGNHNLGAYMETTAPTYEAAGSEHAYCTVCNYEVTREIPPLQQGADQVDSDNTWHHDASGHWKDYDNNVKYDEGNHNLGAWSETTAPTYEAAGSEHAYCTVCNYEVTREIPKLTETMETAIERVSLSNGFMSSFSTQGGISISMGTFILDFRDKTAAVSGQYQNVSTDQALGYSQDFASSINQLLSTISGEFNVNGNGANLVINLAEGYEGIVNQIIGLFGEDTAAANAFRDRLDAYRQISYITNRFQEGNGITPATEKTAAFNSFCASHGITVSGTPAEMQAALLAELKSTMPRAAGAARFNLLQQLEDWARFGACVDDILALGKEPGVDTVAAAPQRLRESIILANGTYLADMHDDRRHGMSV